MGITCFLFLVTLATVAARRARQSGSSVGVQFGGTIAVNNSDATSNQTEAIQEDAMLDNLVNSQMAVINQSMPPPMIRAKKAVAKFCRHKNKAKGAIDALKQNKPLQKIDFGADADITELAININQDWMMAYVEGTSVCQTKRTLSGQPELIEALTPQEEDAIGMYTASFIFQEVNAYMSLDKERQDNGYMNQYIQIVKRGLGKIQGLKEYASQEDGRTDPVKVLYRGFGSASNWTRPKGTKSITSFWSTSELEEVALDFMTLGGDKDYTLLKIEGGLEFARPIAFLSCRPDELEFLFLPGATFQVHKVTQEVKNSKSVKVVTGVVVGQ